MKSKKTELWRFVEGQKDDGKVQRFSVYKEGNSFYIKAPNSPLYPCHPSVKNEEDVKREIALVFNVKVISAKLPRKLHKDRHEDSDRSKS